MVQHEDKGVVPIDLLIYRSFDVDVGVDSDGDSDI